MSKNFADKSFSSVVAVVHKMVLKAPNGLDAKSVASVAGVNYQTMMSELSRQQGHKLGADLLLPLMDACDSDAPVEFLARQRGGVFVTLPEVAVPGCEELVTPMSEALKEFSEWVEAIGRHMRDGVLEDRERREFDEHCDDLIESVLRFKKTYHAVNALHNQSRKARHEPC